MSSFFHRKTLLITGGTGSFGTNFARYALRELQLRRLIILSRDELKQHQMQQDGFTQPNLRYFIGDVRDPDRLRRAFTNVDIVIHAAALKQVPACEYNPMEAVQTNINGTRNVIEAAIDRGVERVLLVSTDKAASPSNLYGATKMVAEKLMVQANAYAGEKGTRLGCVRYGNVVGSRGSVIPLFLKQRATGTITVTDLRMTRFWITLEQAVKFVASCVEQLIGGEIFVPKIPTAAIAEIAAALAADCAIQVTGIRPGEKLHEVLINEDEARHTVSLPDRFLIQPLHPWWSIDAYPRGEPLPEGYRYGSDNNQHVLDAAAIRALIGRELVDA